MTRPLVTIISPTYNQERFVAGCAESALSQTYPEWEQIFVDDGSTDQTRAILESFDDPRIRVLALPHAGLPALQRSYNAALAVARGSLVAILEGDDLWPADKLEIQVPSFEAADTFLSWGAAELIDASGAPVGEMVRMPTTAPRARLRAREAFFRLTRANIFTPTVTVMIRRESLDRIGGFRQSGSSLLVDLPTWLWATASEDGHAEFINRRLGRYRVHGAQASQRARRQMTLEHIAVVRAVERELGAHQLARIGWDARARQSAESRAMLAEGEAALDARQYAPARTAFLRAVRRRGGVADVMLAVVGVLSTLLRLNLVRPSFALRSWARRKLVRSRVA